MCDYNCGRIEIEILIVNLSQEVRFFFLVDIFGSYMQSAELKDVCKVTFTAA